MLESSNYEVKNKSRNGSIGIEETKKKIEIQNHENDDDGGIVK